MKKAQNLLEVALIISVVAIVSIVTFTGFNNLKTKLSSMSKVTVRGAQSK